MALILKFRDFYVLIILPFSMVGSSHLQVMIMVGIFLDAFESVLNDIVVLNILAKG